MMNMDQIGGEITDDSIEQKCCNFLKIKLDVYSITYVKINFSSQILFSKFFGIFGYRFSAILIK